MMCERQKVVKEALTWSGTPYHHEGRRKGAGVDCAMLLAEVYHAAGVLPYIKVDHYAYDWHKNKRRERYLEEVLKHAHEVEIPLPGDMVIWQFARTFSHGAIVIAWPTIIHAYIDRKCGIENVSQAHWLTHRGESDNKPRPVKFFRPNKWGAE